MIDSGKLGYQDYKDFIGRFVLELNKRFKSNLLACALFGSVARGSAKPESDLDFLIILKKKSPQVENEMINFLVETDSWDEKEALFVRNIYSQPSVILRTEKELKEDPLILLDILDDGIILQDRYKVLDNLLKQLKLKLKELGSEKVILPDGTWYWDLKPDWKPKEVVEIKL